MSELEKKYESHYELLWKEFVSKIKDVDVIKCPEPHLPVYGKNYENSIYKIAFVGIETGGASALDKYKKIEDLPQIIYDWTAEFEGLMNKGAWKWNFWRFIFQFLADFYNEDINEFKKKELKPHIEKILNSFIWANTSSIERFHISAKKEGVSCDNWKKVKDASKIFDRAENILEVFKPNILILLNWTEASQDWFPKEMGDVVEIKELPLRHYFLENYNTHLCWTYHPRAMKRNFNYFSLAILQDIKKWGKFPSFPGESILLKLQYQEEKFKKLQLQFKEIAEELKMKYIFDLNEFGLKRKGIYFFKVDWKSFEIGFQFEDNGFQGFFYGMVRKKSSNENFKDIESIKNVLISKLGIPEGSNPKCFVWWKWDKYRNWNEQTFTAIENGEFSKYILIQIQDILKRLEGVEL